jgi:hypothetical protein
MSLTINRATTTVDLCLDLSLKADHERAAAHLDDVRRESAQDQREASSAVSDAAAAVQDLEAKMKAATLKFTLQAVTRKRWNEFELAHPPREDNESDASIGVDSSALDEILRESVTTVTNPAGEVVPFDPATEWAPLADDMSSAQWNLFALATLALNNGATSAPFSQAASRVIQRSAATSKQPSA